MDSALFFRNISNIEELKNLTAKEKGILCEYNIIGRIELDESEYIFFCNNFKRGHAFLYPYIESSRVITDKWNCILVSGMESPDILVMTNGYQYPRFVALSCEQSK